MTDVRTTFFDKCFKKPDGKLAIGQFPNFPLIIWAVGSILAMALHGHAKQAVHIIAEAALFVWALLEIVQGVNYFRRALGIVVLLGLVMMLFR